MKKTYVFSEAELRHLIKTCVIEGMGIYANKNLDEQIDQIVDDVVGEVNRKNGK